MPQALTEKEAEGVEECEPEGEAEPCRPPAAPEDALGLPVAHPLREAEGVVEVETVPVTETLGLRLVVLLAEVPGEGDPVALGVLVGEALPLTVLEPDTEGLGEAEGGSKLGVLAPLSEGVGKKEPVPPYEGTLETLAGGVPVGGVPKADADPVTEGLLLGVS